MEQMREHATAETRASLFMLQEKILRVANHGPSPERKEKILEALKQASPTVFEAVIHAILHMHPI